MKTQITPFAARAIALSMAASISACAPGGTTDADAPESEAEIGTASSALLSGKLFPARGEDLPPGAVWIATNDHHDMHVRRFDTGAGAWTTVRPGVGTVDSPEDYLAYGIPVYASDDGEVVTCWRNAPDNPLDTPHPGRDGCNDEDEDGNPCDQNVTCSCTVPRSGNHLNILSADGNMMLYAHLMPGSVPKEICPHEDEFVTHAEELDPTLGGPKGYNPDMFVPAGSRAFVQKGQFLGYVGDSGASGGPHLHHHMIKEDTGTKIPVSYVGASIQTYPGGSTNASENDWAPLDGSTLLDTGTSDILIRPDDGPGNAWAYAWAQSATTDHNAPSNYSRNSSGDVFGAGVTNTVTHMATGEYLVAFPAIGSVWSGNVQVSAYGTDNVRCKVRGAISLWSAATVRVDCHAPNGALADSKFVVSYVRKGSPTGVGEGAYLTTTDEGSGVVPIINQWNSSGEPNSVERLSAGRYRVRMPGQLPRPRGGTVQVTAFGASSDSCKVASWGTNLDAVTAEVRCFDTSGVASDSLFSLFYTPEHAAGGLSGGHAWANDATTNQYSPPSFYEYTHKAGIGEIAASTTAYRTGTGAYQVRYPALSTTGSTTLVTAYGTTADYCKLSGWSSSGTDSLVTIRCFNASGNAVNTTFVSGYANVDFTVL